MPSMATTSLKRTSAVSRHAGDRGSGTGLTGQHVHALEVGAGSVEAQSLVHHARELVGAGGGEQHARGQRIARHLLKQVVAAGGVRVDYVVVLIQQCLMDSRTWSSSAQPVPKIWRILASSSSGISYVPHWLRSFISMEIKRVSPSDK